MKQEITSPKTAVEKTAMSDCKQLSANCSGGVVALDLGTQTGWALCVAGGEISSGSHSFKPSRFEGGGMRYLRFAKWLEALQQRTGGIDAIYFEAVRRHLGVDASHAYGSFLGVLTVFCEQNHIPYLGVAVGTIKKHITGFGNASKQQVITAISAKGFKPVDDNEADALALLDLVLTQNNAVSGVRKHNTTHCIT